MLLPFQAGVCEVEVIQSRVCVRCVWRFSVACGMPRTGVET